MYVFGNDRKARGCFTRFNILTSLGRGAYLKLPSFGTMPSGDYSDPMLVTGISFAQREKYHLVQCFRDVVHTYAFGHDPSASSISLTYTGFMVDTDGTDLSSVFEQFIFRYQANRLSKIPLYSEILIGSTSLTGFLTGMVSATKDEQYNLQRFELNFLAVSVQGWVPA